MKNEIFELIIASPPERDELVVQLFWRIGGQWAEIFRENGVYMIEIYGHDKSPARVAANEMIDVISQGVELLRQRLES